MHWRHQRQCRLTDLLWQLSDHLERTPNHAQQSTAAQDQAHEGWHGRQESGQQRNGSGNGLTCVALATGMKCLPRAKLPQAQGNVLHDWHAEVLAMRGFNRWILDECLMLAREKDERKRATDWVQWSRHGAEDQSSTTASKAASQSLTRPPFELKSGISIHMYCSAAPCGDASMELLMRSQADSTPWTHPAPSANPNDMIGRGHFDQLGVVRKKPARPDAPSTLSKSCSDKLSMKQVTGLLSGLAAKLVWPGNCYLDSLVLPEQELVKEGVDRAFGREGRMRVLTSMEEKEGYAFRPFKAMGTSRVFEYASKEEARGSDLSALWTPHKQEILINGVLQGRKQLDPRGASCVSRRSMWALARDVADLAEEGGIQTAHALERSTSKTYAEFKLSASGARESVKEDARKRALQGWRQNLGDEEWSIHAT